MPATIWWARRDLRLSDNQALAAAAQAAGPGGQVVPVFVLDPALLAASATAEKRLAFLYAGLRALDADLRARGSRLLVRHGDPAKELGALLAETGASSVFAETDPWPYARSRDAAVARLLPLELAGGLTIHPPDLVRKTDGQPYTVYTPFARAWRRLPLPLPGDLLPGPESLSTPTHLQSLPLPGVQALRYAIPFVAGEAEAQRRLATFVSGDEAPIARYASDRDRPDLPGTSALSPYLRFGMVSARIAAVAAIDAGQRMLGSKGPDVWLAELIWREFYTAILYHFPAVLDEAFRTDLRDVPWDNDAAAYAAWCEGRTGYPIVDAGMRQLVATGWMHNRARMIVASFLVKDLLVDWRWGEAFFMQHLLDADPSANNGGWQWVAGTGTDAAPYFRIFNPVLQGQRYDPHGTYVRRWLPELAQVPRGYVHEPWRMPTAVQQAAGCVIGRDYPAPIVDHAQARERALAAYKLGRARQSRR